MENESKKDENVINGFFGKYNFLSLASPFLYTFDGIDFPTLIHAFYAFKTLKRDCRLEIADIKTPYQVFIFAEEKLLPPSWWTQQYQILLGEDLTRIKFNIDTHPELVKKLLETGNKKLDNVTVWNDPLLGIYKGKGENQGGIMVMKQRAILNQKAIIR